MPDHELCFHCFSLDGFWFGFGCGEGEKDLDAFHFRPLAFWPSCEVTFSAFLLNLDTPYQISFLRFISLFLASIGSLSGLRSRSGLSSSNGYNVGVSARYTIAPALGFVFGPV